MDNPYYEKLVNAAIRFVSFRPRSEKEFRDFLSKKLTKWKVSGDLLISKVIARMEELGYINDKKFASWWVEQRNTFRPKGAALLEAELKQKGIIIRGLKDEKDGAKVAAEKKLRLLKQLPLFEKKKKLYGFLGRRGFSSETIARVVDEVLSDSV